MSGLEFNNTGMFYGATLGTLILFISQVNGWVICILLRPCKIFLRLLRNLI